jgi:hypothetical protein
MIGREKYRFWIVIVRLVYEIQKLEDDCMDKWVNMNWKSEYLCSRQGSELTLRLAKEVVPLQVARKCAL